MGLNPHQRLMDVGENLARRVGRCPAYGQNRALRSSLRDEIVEMKPFSGFCGGAYFDPAELLTSVRVFFF